MSFYTETYDNCERIILKYVNKHPELFEKPITKPSSRERKEIQYKYYSQEVKDAVLADAKNGMRIKELMKKYNIGRSVLRLWTTKAGIFYKHPNPIRK